MRPFVLACMFVLSVATASIGTALGQETGELAPFDHPLFTGPVHSMEAEAFDLLHVRMHLFISPEEHTIRVRYFADFAVADTSTNILSFPAAGLLVESIQLIDPDSTVMDVDWELKSDTVHIRLPPLDRSEYGLLTDFQVLSEMHTRPLGSDSGPWTLVWTPFGRGVPTWLGMPVRMDDRFTTDFRVSVPSTWSIFLSGIPRFELESDGSKTAGSWFESTSTVTNLGFIALTDVAFETNDGVFVSGDPSTDPRGIEETMISLARMSRFFEGKIDAPRSDATVRVVLPDPGRLMISGASLSILPTHSIPSGLDPVTEDFELAQVVAREWTEEHVPVFDWTDIWIQEGLSAFMAAEYVRNRHGDPAYNHVMWSCRDRYLNESRNYVRPLVWDRWSDPEDLLDEHATCKGAWVFHMLSSDYPETPVWTALGYLAETGLMRGVTSEELRMALERSSGKDLAAFFDQWVYAAGHPKLEFDYQVASDQTTIRTRIQQVQEGYLNPSAYVFDIELESASLAGVDKTTIRVADVISTSAVNVQLRPQYVRLDPRGVVLFEYAAAQDPATLVSSLRRQESPATRYVAARELEETNVDASLLIGLRPVLAAETSPLVRRSLIRVLSRMAPSATAFRELLTLATDSTSRSKPQAIAAMAPFSGQAEARATALRAANSSSDPLMLASSVEALVQLDSTLAWRVLQSAMVTESRGNIVRRTAVRLIPDVPADDTDKIAALLSVVTRQSDQELIQTAVSALSKWSETERVRSAVLSMSIWTTASTRTRAAIIDLISNGSLRPNEEAVIRRWARVEPDHLLRHRLHAILNR